MVTRKQIREALERLDASEKQINAIIIKCKSLPSEKQDEALDYIDAADNLQDIFDYLREGDNQSSDEDYIDLRDYPHIPTNAVKQYSSRPRGVWFRLTRGEWIFVKKENLEKVRFNWNSAGEIVIPERLRRV